MMYQFEISAELKGRVQNILKLDSDNLRKNEKKNSSLIDQTKLLHHS